eukprot:865013_1
MECANLDDAATKAKADIVNRPTDPIHYSSSAPVTVEFRCKSNHVVSGTITEDSNLKTKPGSIALIAECALNQGSPFPAWMSKMCVPLTCSDPPAIDNAVKDSENKVIGDSAQFTCNQHFVVPRTTKSFQDSQCIVIDPSANTRMIKWTPVVDC